MSKPKPDDDTMREEYDFTGGVRGKYASRFAKGSNVVTSIRTLRRPSRLLLLSTMRCVRSFVRARLPASDGRAKPRIAADASEPARLSATPSDSLFHGPE